MTTRARRIDGLGVQSEIAFDLELDRLMASLAVPIHYTIPAGVAVEAVLRALQVSVRARQLAGRDLGARTGCRGDETCCTPGRAAHHSHHSQVTPIVTTTAMCTVKASKAVIAIGLWATCQ